MKTRLLTTVLFMAASLSSFAQNNATLPLLKEATGRVFDFTLQNDYQSLLEITYPTVFSEISEKEYLDNFKKTNKGDGFIVHHKDTDRQLTFGPIAPFNGGYYCVIYYNFYSSIALDKPLKKDEEQKMLDRFKEYGKIYYEASDNSFVVRGRKSMVAVLDNASGNFWSFILDAKAPYVQNIIPIGAKVELNPELYPNGIPEEPAQAPVTTKPADPKKNKVVLTEAQKKEAKEKAANSNRH